MPSQRRRNTNHLLNMKLVLLYIVVTLLSVARNEVFAQIPYFSACPQVSVVKNFDAEAYLGLWYEYEKYPFFFEIGGKCITATYTLRPDGKIGVFNRQINRILGNESSITGSAVQDAREPAKLRVTFPTAPTGGDAPYWVLATDYHNYAVVYSCAEFGGFASARTVWILTRDQYPEERFIRIAYDVLDSRQLSRTFLMRTDHTNCDAGSRKTTTHNDIPDDNSH